MRFAELVVLRLIVFRLVPRFIRKEGVAMEQLDLVYKTFVNLEKNYARSKKTREEYILEKFGGDINVGSFLILNALSSQELTDPDDIQKFSKVREIFQAIKDNQNRLNTLSSFNFEEDAASTAILNALDSSWKTGTHIELCEQHALYASRGALHFDIRPGEAQESSLADARYLGLYSKAMVLFAQQFTTDAISLGDVVEKRLWNQYDKVAKPEF